MDKLPEEFSEEIINDIQKACAALGWNVSFDESSPGIVGLIIGQPDYVEDVVASLANGEQYVIYSSGAELDTELH